MHPWEEWGPIAGGQHCRKPMGYRPSNGTLCQGAALILESVSMAWERLGVHGEVILHGQQLRNGDQGERTRKAEKREWQGSRMSSQSHMWRGSGAYWCCVWNLSAHVHPKAAGQDWRGRKSLALRQEKPCRLCILFTSLSVPLIMYSVV